MAPFLRGANPVFLKFIEDGLADMDRQQQQSTTQTNSNNGASGNQMQANNPVSTLGNVLADSGQAPKMYDYYKDRLEYWTVRHLISY